MSTSANQQAGAILAAILVAILIIVHCINANLVGVVLLVVKEDIVYIRHSQILTPISEGIQHAILYFILKKGHKYYVTCLSVRLGFSLY